MNVSRKVLYQVVFWSLLCNNSELCCRSKFNDKVATITITRIFAGSPRVSSTTSAYNTRWPHNNNQDLCCRFPKSEFNDKCLEDKVATKTITRIFVVGSPRVSSTTSAWETRWPIYDNNKKELCYRFPKSKFNDKCLEEKLATIIGYFNNVIKPRLGERFLYPTSLLRISSQELEVISTRFKIKLNKS